MSWLIDSAEGQDQEKLPIFKIFTIHFYIGHWWHLVGEKRKLNQRNIGWLHWETAGLCEARHKIWHHNAGGRGADSGLLYPQKSAKFLCFGVEVKTWFTHDKPYFCWPPLSKPKILSWALAKEPVLMFLTHNLADQKVAWPSLVNEYVIMNSAEPPCVQCKQRIISTKLESESIHDRGKIIGTSWYDDRPNLTLFHKPVETNPWTGREVKLLESCSDKATEFFDNQRYQTNKQTIDEVTNIWACSHQASATSSLTRAARPNKNWRVK